MGNQHVKGRISKHNWPPFTAQQSTTTSQKDPHTGILSLEVRMKDRKELGSGKMEVRGLFQIGEGLNPIN